MPDFILRDVPDQLHVEWKFFSGQRGMSMRKYILLSLKSLVDRDKEDAPLKKSKEVPS